ncbi:MAG TPA: glycosyltransferase family 9 protein [Bacteroidales bacterium]|nr:glycosyltransferase family 9 protein [Bacteroidales bacterium]
MKRGANIKKVLVIRFSSIGDIVLTTPVVRCLKNQLPEAEIHYLTKTRYAPLLSSNPYIDRIHCYGEDYGILLKTLKAEHFDFIADLHRSLRSRYILLNLRRPHATFSKLNLRKWMLVRMKIDRLPHIHVVDRYFGAVSPLGIRNDGKGLDYFIPPPEEIRPGDVFPAAAGGFIAMAIGARHQTKILPVEKAAEVCRKADKPMILLGGAEDRERGDRIAGQAGDRVFNACGKLSVNQSASVIRQADALITNDTGMMHIGAAFRKRIISVWGNTVPAFGMYPYLPEGSGHLSRIVEVKGLDCRPCSKLGYDRCPKGHFNCMNLIRTSDILEAL